MTRGLCIGRSAARVVRHATASYITNHRLGAGSRFDLLPKCSLLICNILSLRWIQNIFTTNRVRYDNNMQIDRRPR